MKKKSLLLSILLLGVFFSACIEDLNFEQPQPAGVRNIAGFKAGFQGTYTSLNDSCTLTITTDKIIQHWHAIEKVTQAELDTMADIEVIDSLIYTDDFPEPLQLEYFGDSARVTIDFDEPFFTPGDSQFVRWFKGYYFLNYQGENGLWTIKALKFEKTGRLTVYRFDSDEDAIKELKAITRLNEILDADDNVVGHTANPTRQEFKKILKADLFKVDSEYINSLK